MYVCYRLSLSKYRYFIGAIKHFPTKQTMLSTTLSLDSSDGVELHVRYAMLSLSAVSQPHAIAQISRATSCPRCCAILIRLSPYKCIVMIYYSQFDRNTK